MKTLGRKSVSSGLKKIITFLFYLEFLLIFTLPLVFFDDVGIRYSWPVTLTSKQSQPLVTTNTDGISGFIINERYQIAGNTSKKILSFSDSSTGRRLLQTLHNVVTIVAILLITFWLKKLFSDLAADKPFNHKNSKRVRWIAWAVISLVLFDVVKTFLYRSYTASTVFISGGELDFYDFSFDVRAFLLGLLLLIIAELFRRAHEYQIDSESIV